MPTIVCVQLSHHHTGYEAADDALFMSNGIGTMVINALGHQVMEDAKIICNLTDTCYINCNTSTACKDATVQQMQSTDTSSTVIINCNSNFICPTLTIVQIPTIPPTTTTITTTSSQTTTQPTTTSGIVTTAAIPMTTSDTTSPPTTTATASTAAGTTSTTTSASVDVNTTNAHNTTTAINTPDGGMSSRNSGYINYTTTDGDDSGGTSKLDDGEGLRQFSGAYYWIILGFGVCLIVVTFIGWIDARFIRRFEMYRHWNIILFGAYTLDFISDLFFMGQVWILGNITLNDNDSSQPSFEFYVFVASVVFILIPLFGTIFQLQSAIKDWIFDADCKQIVRSYVKNYVKFLYFISFVSGSSFSGLELCNSFLFQMHPFGLDLPKQQRALFKNKRIFSVVLLENIPQFVVQTAFSIHIGNVSVITIFSIGFSLLSIILTCFEFYTKKLLLHTETIIVLKFNVESSKIKAMPYRRYHSRIAYKRRRMQSEMSKMLSIEYHTIELLKPVRNTEGAVFTFYIRTDLLDQNDVMDMIIRPTVDSPSITPMQSTKDLREESLSPAPIFDVNSSTTGQTSTQSLGVQERLKYSKLQKVCCYMVI